MTNASNDHSQHLAAADHDSVYDGLLGGDASQWAFGTDFEDPLAGVDTTVADGVDPSVLGRYCLMLGDDALIYAQRLAQWCSNAPDLEEDIAIANIALDLLGQARLLLSRAAAADSTLLPALPEGSPIPPEDALAFFRDEASFCNVRLVETPDSDFAMMITRLLLFSTWRLALAQRLSSSRDTVLSAIAGKAVKELTYHRDYAARWFLTLGRGTEESKRRLREAMTAIWPLRDELFLTHEVEAAAAAQGIGVDPATVADEVDVLWEQVFSVSNAARPTGPPMGKVQGRSGRGGVHTESMGPLLAQMQVVARAHPMGKW